MPRRLVTAVAVLGAIALLSPAAAGANDWAFAGDKRLGVLRWQYAGGVEGRPGNAHSGGFYLDTSDGRIWAMWLDWRCPTGVTPPQDSAAQTSCSLMREEVGAAAVNVPADYETLGAVGLDLHKTVRTTVRTPAGTSQGRTTLDLTLRPSAAPTRETTYWQDASRRYKRVTSQAPGVLASGRAGWVALAGPATTIVSAELTAARTFTRPLAAPVSTAATKPAQEWTLAAQGQVARFSWRVSGAVPRRPGNAHNGTFALAPDGFSVRMRWLDWQCPGGVNPPFDPQTPTRCLLRRADQAKPYVETPDDYHAVGRVGFDLDKTFEVAQIRAEGRATSIARADFTLLPRGTLARKTTYWTDGATRHKKVTWTAPATPAISAAGAVGWVVLTDARTTVVGPRLQVWAEYTRPVAGPE